MAAKSRFDEILEAMKSDDIETVRALVVKCDASERDETGWTLLHHAASLGKTCLVNLLIDLVDVNKQDETGSTPLFLACKDGHCDVACILLDNMADVNQPANSGDTPLHVASENGHNDVVRLLLTRSARLDKGNQFDGSPLYIASEKGYVEVVRSLLQANADVNQTMDEFGFTPLLVACEKGHLEVVRLLLSASADANYAATHGTRRYTPLYFACQIGQTEIVQLLLEAAADVNYFGEYNESPLYQACLLNHVEIARMLLEASADITILNRNGPSLLYAACGSGSVEIVRLLLPLWTDVNEYVNDFMPLFAACRNGQLDVVRLLLEASADVNRSISTGETPLHAACVMGHFEIVQFLLTSPISVNQQTKNGTTPLWYACQNGNIEVIRSLLNASANINLAREDGATPLFIACQQGQIDVVHLLIDASADIGQAKNDGSTPLHCACKYGHIDVFKALMGACADFKRKDNNGKTPLHIAIEYNQVRMLHLFMENEADFITTDETGKTYLHWAVELGLLDVVKLLLPFELHQSKDNDGNTPLDIAQENKNAKIVEILEERLAVDKALEEIKARNLSWDHRFQRGMTLLIMATKQGCFEVIQEAFDNGCDPTLQDDDGNSALHWAAQNANFYVALILCSRAFDSIDLELRNQDMRTPFELAMLSGHFECAVVLIAFKCNWDNYFQGKLLLEVLAPFLTNEAAETILLNDMPIKIQDGIVLDRTGHCFSWTTFLDPSLPVKPNVRAAVVRSILEQTLFESAANKRDVYKALAYAKDRFGREIWHATDSQTRQLFKNVLLFCSRYEIFDGPAVHVSATSVVVYAYDHGICEQVFDEYEVNGFLNAEQFIACNRTLGRQSVERNAKDKTFLRDTEKWNEEYALWDKDKNGEMTKPEFLSYCQQSFGGKIKVVLKFMRSESDYIREIESRKLLRGAMSVDLMLSLPLAVFQQNAPSLTLHGGIDMKDYPNVLVMSAADRSLEDIFLKERPTEIAIRGMLEEVAKHLAEIHDHGLVHGDVKKLNVLRVQNHVLKFIDFDAATPIGQPMGSKFSSGVLPPEMFCKLETKEAVASHKAYWQDQMQDPQQWKKLKPREKYVVRSFRPENTAQLPYSLVNASPAVDMWSFGCMVYQMLSGVELLPTDVNQDVVTDRIKLAATWTDEELKARIESNISDEHGQDLVLRLLVCDPEKRMSAKDALNHPYFTSLMDNTDLLEALESMEKANRQVEATVQAISEEVGLGRKINQEATEKSKSALKQATAAISTGLFEASEVTVPTSFVVLPYKISREKTANKEKAKQLIGFMTRFQNTCQKVSKALMEGNSVGEFLTTFMHSEPLYLYLIDEANGRVVVPKEEDEVYPIEIPTDKTTFLTTCLPWIQRGFQILKVTNAIGDKIGVKPWDAWLEGVGLKSTDDDGDDDHNGDKDSDEEKDPLEEAIDSVLEIEPTITFDVIARGLKNKQVPVKQVRGVALRELKKFLDENDPEHSFAGLERTLTDQGRLQWTIKQEDSEGHDQILEDIRQAFFRDSNLP